MPITLLNTGFESDSINSLPSGFTSESGSWRVTDQITAAYGTKGLAPTSATDGTILSYTPGFNVADSHIKFCWKLPTGANEYTTPKFSVGIRVNSSTGQGYWISPGNMAGNGIGFSFSKGTSGNGTIIDLPSHSGGSSWAAGKIIWFEALLVGSSIKFRGWFEGDAVPAYFEYTDATYTTGILKFRYNNSAGLTPQYGIDSLMYVDEGATAATSLSWTSPPSTGIAGVASSLTVTADAAAQSAVTITPTSTLAGTFNPTNPQIASGQSSVTFTFTPTVSGSHTLSLTNNGALSNPSGHIITVTAAASGLSISGNETANVNSAVSYTVTADAAVQSAVTITPTSTLAGTFNPTNPQIASGQSSVTFTFTPTATGSHSIALTSNSALSNPAAKPLVVSAAAATALTCTPTATSFPINTPSPPFIIGANGSLTGDKTITPSSAGGGTFSPTSAIINTANPTASFTYQRSTTGFVDLVFSTTGLSSVQESLIQLTAAPSYKVIAVTDTNIFYSPGNWDTVPAGTFGQTATVKQTTCVGAYLKFNISGAPDGAVIFDVPSGADPIPKVDIFIGGTRARPVSSTRSDVAYSVAWTATNDGTPCTVEIRVSGMNLNNREGSNGVSPLNVVRIKELRLNSAASSLIALTNIKPGRGLISGDSITEGAGINEAPPGGHDTSWAPYFATAMNSEYGQIGYSGHSILSLTTTWNTYSVGRPRTFGTLDWIISLYGTNSGGTASDMQTIITGWRTQCGPNTRIFIAVPHTYGSRDILYNAVANYKAANPSDTKVYFIEDHLTRIPIAGVLHPPTVYQAYMAAALADSVKAIIASETAGSGGGSAAPLFSNRFNRSLR